MFTLKNALVVIAFASQCALSGLAWAQDGKVATEKPAAGETSRVGGMFKGKENPDPVLVKRYVQNEVARFSNVTPESDMAGFAAIRNLLISTIRSSASEPTKKIAADHVLTLTKSIAVSPKFHNIARINAMAALSELELASNSPYPATLSPLVVIARDEAQPLPLRAIALYGLNRHAKFTRLSPEQVDGLGKVVTAIVVTKPRSAIDVKPHAWVVRRSFDVLSTLGTAHAAVPAIAKLLDDKELPSVRLAAADYLPRVDQSKLKLSDEQKVQYFIGLAQLLEQQLVMWYEREEDTLNMKSGAAGMGAGGGMGMGMGSGMEMGMGMGEGSGGMSMGGMDGSMGMGSGMEMGMGGMGSGGMGSGGMGTAPKARPLDTQPWEVRMTRRHVNQILQTVHVALDGKQIKTGRPVSAAGKGLVDMELPAEIATPATELVKAVESLQTRINDSTKITTMNSLLTQTKKLIERVMDEIREIPALTGHYPKYQEKKEELGEIHDQPKDTPPAGEGDKPADANKDAAGDAPADASAPAAPKGAAEGN